MVRISSDLPNPQNSETNRKLSYAKISHNWINSKKIKYLSELIGKATLGIFIIPCFIPSYRKWVQASYIKLTSPNKPRHTPAKIHSMEHWWKRLGSFEHDSNLNRNDSLRKAQTNQDKRKYEKGLKNLESGHIAKKYPLMGKVNRIPGEYGLWMAGVGLVASYLSEKHKLEGLYVCNTLEAFASKLNEISQHHQDQRAAFVIPTFYSGSSGCTMPNFPQHKITVVVEKKTDQLKIAILDSDVTGQNSITPSHLECNDIWDGWKKPDAFTPDELALRALLKSYLVPNSQLFYSKVPREVAYGCESYALTDALAYLKDPDFFNKITTSEETPLKNGLMIRGIVRLPPSLMIGSQRFTALKDYVKSSSPESLKIPGRKNKTLKEYIKRNRVIVIDKKLGRKKQNHYITKKTFKYTKIALNIMQNFASENIEEILNKTFIA